MRFHHFSDLLDYRAAVAPDAPALRYGERRCTFAELRDRVRQRAEALWVEGKTCMGILSDGSMDCVIEIFAANLAGLQIVMLDENAPEELLRRLLVYTDVDTLWGDSDLLEELSPALTAGVEDGAGKILFFTSGTTEQAKAVVLTDHSLCQSAWNGAQKLPLTPEDTLLCLLPLGHVFGFVCGLLWGLSCGACVALGRGARHYLDDFRFYEPTAVSVVPLVLSYLLKAKALNLQLKLILVGAGDCPPALLSAANAMGIRVSFGYGLTETSSGVAISVSGDPYAMEICPDDTISLAEDGEILIHAPTCIMQSYYKMPASTDAVLKDGILHSGDLGRFDEEGKLHITGRKKEMLVLSDGTKIFLPEYESRIMAALDHTELTVIEKSGRPVLVYSGQASRGDLTRRLMPLMASLPRGQQLSGIIIINDPLPRTATGKIKRWELQQKAGLL